MGGSNDEPETRPVGGEGEARNQLRALFEPGLLLQSTDQPVHDDNRKHIEKIGQFRWRLHPPATSDESMLTDAPICTDIVTRRGLEAPALDEEDHGALPSSLVSRIAISPGEGPKMPSSRHLLIEIRVTDSAA